MNLENLGVQELNSNELLNIDGGTLPNTSWVVGSLVGAYEWGASFMEGFGNGFNAAIENYNGGN